MKDTCLPEVREMSGELCEWSIEAIASGKVVSCIHSNVIRSHHLFAELPFEAPGREATVRT